MIIDLSVPLNQQTPVYPGDPKTKISPAGIFKKDGYNDHQVSIGTHVGTHIDAPLHMIDRGKDLSKIPLEQFVGRGRYIKVGKNFDLAKIKNAGITKGDIVLFHTGMGTHYHQPSYFESYPDMNQDIAQYLIDKKIKMIGLDSCSPDHPPFPIHRLLLSSGILIIENLTNLSKLAGKKFKVYALPIRLELDGAPARVIAEL